MRQRIRNILILMCICILGIFLFQGYWLYNSYQIRGEQFNKEIDDCLRTAVFKKQLADVRPYLHNVGKDKDSLKWSMKQLAVQLKKFGRMKGKGFKGYRDFEGMSGTPHWDTIHKNSPARSLADTLVRQISNYYINSNINNDSTALIKLDSFFRAELISQQIMTSYKLDTFHMNYSGIISQAFKDNFFRKKSGQTNKNFFYSPNLFVQATFTSPLQFILMKMIWTLFGSMVLLALTILCFTYMLRTILKQKKLSEVKNDFINNMTHELQTPIATVSAAVEALQHFNALNDQRKTQTYLDISKNELQRLSDLVEKVLHIAAEEKEDFELYKEATNLDEIIESIFSTHRLKSSKTLQLKYDNHLSGQSVYVDKIHVSNVINNLVDNAIKYSGEQLQLILHASINDHVLTIRVKDNGIGIPKIYQNNIFDKFFRVPTGNLHNVKGFGLGLSYVQKIVQMHYGTISVQSEPGAGSEFIIHIPLVYN